MMMPSAKDRLTLEEFDKLPELGERWLSHYNKNLMRKIKSSFDLKECLRNYDYPCSLLLRELEMDIPKAIKRGYLEPDELWNVIRWKIYTLGPAAKASAKRNFVRNTPEDIRSKTRIFLVNLDMTEKETESYKFYRSLKNAIKNASSVSSPDKIVGVNVRMVSAILRFINPSRYGIFDVNAMRSLKNKFSFVIPSISYTPQAYVNYLEFITEFGNHFNLKPAETDMALYMHGKKVKKCYGCCTNANSEYYCKS